MPRGPMLNSSTIREHLPTGSPLAAILRLSSKPSQNEVPRQRQSRPAADPGSHVLVHFLGPSSDRFHRIGTQPVLDAGQP